MAKTTGKIQGNLILTAMDGETIGCTTGATFNGTTERVETTCKDNGGAKTYEPGSQDGNLQVNGIVKFDTVSNFPAIVAAWKGKTEVVWTHGALENSDDTYIQFTGFISDLTWEGPMNEPSRWSFTSVPTSEILVFNT